MKKGFRHFLKPTLISKATHEINHEIKVDYKKEIVLAHFKINLDFKGNLRFLRWVFLSSFAERVLLLNVCVNISCVWLLVYVFLRFLLNRISINVVSSYEECA